MQCTVHAGGPVGTHLLAAQVPVHLVDEVRAVPSLWQAIHPAVLEQGRRLQGCVQESTGDTQSRQGGCQLAGRNSLCQPFISLLLTSSLDTSTLLLDMIVDLSLCVECAQCVCGAPSDVLCFGLYEGGRARKENGRGAIY